MKKRPTTTPIPDFLLDRCVVELDDEQYRAFAKALDNPSPPNAKLKNLMRSKAPWENSRE